MTPDGPPHRRLDLVDLVTAIGGRAQATRLRVLPVERLSREHIAGDLAQIDAVVDKLARLLFGPADGGSGRTEATMDERRRPHSAEADRDAGNWTDLVRRDADPDEDDPKARPRANQHSFEREDFATDAARPYHGSNKPA